MISSVGRALIYRAGSRRFIFRNAWKVGAEGREIKHRYLDRGRSGGTRAQFTGMSRREEQEAAGSISGTECERGARGRRFNFLDLV